MVSPDQLPSPDGRPVRTSRMAVLSVILGVLPIPLVTSIPGLVCGIMGLSRIAASERAAAGPRLRGRGLAVTGIVISSLMTLATPVLLGLLLLPAVNAAAAAARNQLAINNLKQVSLAMMTATTSCDAYPLTILGEDETPLLSWRVAILPFLADEAATALFKEFHLDEPWDSEHNATLIPRMPAVFAGAGLAAETGRTGVLLPAAPGMAFGEGDVLMPLVEGGRAKLRGVRPSSLKDGLSNTVLIVSVPGEGIPWTKPDDLGVDAVEFLATLRQAGIWTVPVAMGDASTRLLSTDTPAETARAIFSRAGGEAVSLEF
jgi:hypothetical protein